MPVPSTQFVTIAPAGNGTLYSGYLDGNIPQPFWTQIPNYLNISQSMSVNLRSLYLTPSAGPTLTVVGALPSGWSFNGTTLSYSGVGTGSANIQISAVYLGLAAVPSNVFTVQSVASAGADATAPPIPLGLSILTNDGTKIIIGGYPSSDPNPPGFNWNGFGGYNIKRTPPGSVIGTVSSGTGFQPTFGLSEIGPNSPISTFAQSGADITLTTYAVNPSATDDNLAFGNVQVTGTSWVLSCEIDVWTSAFANSRAMCMVRKSLNTNSAMVSMDCYPFAQGNGVGGEARLTDGASKSFVSSIPNTTAAVRCFLVRNGDTYTRYYSLDGNNPISLGSQTVSLGNTVYVGFGLQSGQAALQVTCQFKQTNLQTLASWTYTDSTIVASTSYAYAVSAQDATGANVSAFGNPLNVTTPSAGVGIKRHYGHYSLSGQKIGPGNKASIFTTNSPGLSIKAEIDLTFANANVLGIQVNIVLAAVEDTVQGTYDWAIIDTIRAYLRDSWPTKRLALSIGDHNFSHPNPVGYIPTYILNGASYGNGYDGVRHGYWQLGTYGIAGRWDNANYGNRVIAMFTDLANHISPYGAGAYTYDTDPFFELVTYTESSLGWNGLPTDYSTQAQALAQVKTQWSAIHQGIVNAFPHTTVMAQDNYFPYGGASDQISSINYEATHRMVLGGPDIQPSITFAQNAYMGVTAGSTDQRGTMEYIAQVQYPDYTLWTTLAQIFALAAGDSTKLRAGRIFWDIRQDATIGNWTQVSAFISANPIPALNQACPSNFAAAGGCVST